MQVATIGLDIAKNVFQVHGIDAAEKVIVRKQLERIPVMWKHSLHVGRNWHSCGLNLAVTPDSTASTTHLRNSKEHGFGIDPLPKIEPIPSDSLIQTSQGIPILPSRNPL